MGRCRSSYIKCRVAFSGGLAFLFEERRRVMKTGNLKCISILLFWIFLVPSSSFGNKITTVDSTENVGWYSSLVIGDDGNPVISYQDRKNGTLKVAKCVDPSCSKEATITTVDPTSGVGEDTSIAIIGGENEEKLPIISYYAARPDYDLKVAKCGNASCSSGNIITTVDAGGFVGNFTSITIGINPDPPYDPRPIISYLYFSNHDLRVAYCGDASCESGNTITTVDPTGNAGWYTSIAIGSDGFPIIAHYAVGSLKVAKCGNVSCTSGNTLNTVDSGVASWDISIAIGADNMPIISYCDDTNGDLKVAKCKDIACNSADVNIVDSIGQVGYHTSIAIGADGLPIISYWDWTYGDLKVAKCVDSSCANEAIITTVDSDGNVGWYTSLAIGLDNRPVISYYDATNKHLKVAKCATQSCGPPANQGSTMLLLGGE